MYKGFNHLQKLNKMLQKRLHRALMSVSSTAAWKHPRGKGSTVFTLSHEKCMQISHYVSQHSNIQKDIDMAAA